MTLIEWLVIAGVIAGAFGAGWRLNTPPKPPIFATISNNGRGGLYVWIDPGHSEEYARRWQQSSDKTMRPTAGNCLRTPSGELTDIPVPTGPIGNPPTGPTGNPFPVGTMVLLDGERSESPPKKKVAPNN